MTTPEALVGRHPRCVWLDGAAGSAGSGRTSHLAVLDADDVSLTFDAGRREVTRWTGAPGRWRSRVVGDDPFVELARELALHPRGRWFGYFGYAARTDLPARRGGEGVPDAVWLRPSRVRTFTDTATPPPGPSAAARPGEIDEAYAAGFARVQEALHAGDSYEVNLTYRRDLATAFTPAELYARLRAANPAPYAGFVAHDVPGASAWLLSSSPERFARIAASADGLSIEARPMKGTTARSDDPRRDGELRERLRTDAKIRAENLMIVDLLRNDIASVSRVGSVDVPELMVTETYAGVHQLVSTVTGLLRDDVTPLAAVHALFPPGSMTGAPKFRTMQVIEEVETSARGAYAGAFGWIDAHGVDLAVVIRSLVSADATTWRAGTGGGITVASDLAEEWAEAGWKLSRLRAALGGQ